MERLIPAVNKLQDVFTHVGGGTSFGIDLPQIVVVGAQSSGKSSVLENIVGRSFLPRGSGIVTRRPLVLQLVKSECESDWAEFLHLPGQKFHDFDVVRSEIERETDRIAGGGKGISSKPINLKVFSKHVLDLTMVDLPGMTKNPVGDQPKDIEIQIRNMVVEYARRDNAIILAVSPANADLANSDSLKLAKELDPEGQRTLGVVTKLDLMDRGTDALDVLLGRVIPLQLGYIGVVNRSQHDIESDKSIQDAVQDERAFFNGHPSYRAIIEQLGTPHLAQTLSEVLLQHIKNCIPALYDTVAANLSSAEKELLSFGQPIADSSEIRGQCMLETVTSFAHSLNDSLEGRSNEFNPVAGQLTGGALISYIFTEHFTRDLEALAVSNSDVLTDEEILTRIRNAQGVHRSLFVPELAFEQLAKVQIERLRDPCLHCAEMVHHELKLLIQGIGDTSHMRSHPKLRTAVHNSAIAMLDEQLTPTVTMISNLINIELGFINTSHPDFTSTHDVDAMLREKDDQLSSQQLDVTNISVGPKRGKGAASADVGMETPAKSGSGKGREQQVANPQSSKKPPPASTGFFDSIQGNILSLVTPRKASDAFSPSPERLHRSPPPKMPAPKPNQPAQNLRLNTDERRQLLTVKLLLHSYLSIVKKNVGDTVPKTLMTLLVNHVQSNLSKHLMKHLYVQSIYDAVFEEDPQVQNARKTCRELISVLEKAKQILQEVHDFH